MNQTYSQIYIQIVFAVKGRQNVIVHPWKTELYQYMAGVIRNKGQKPIIVNGAADHVHVLVGIKPNISVSDLVRDIKNNSSKFINLQGFVKGKFSWQEGFGAFSYSESQLEKVYQYILRQEEHHRKTTFKEEYLDFLNKFSVDYKRENLFEWIE